MTRLVRIPLWNPSNWRDYLDAKPTTGAAKLAYDATRVYKYVRNPAYGGPHFRGDEPYADGTPCFEHGDNPTILEIRFAFHDVNFDLLVHHLKFKAGFSVEQLTHPYVYGNYENRDRNRIVGADWSGKAVRWAEVEKGHDLPYYASRTYRERWRQEALDWQKRVSLRGALGKARLFDGKLPGHLYGPDASGHFVSCAHEGCKRARTDTYWGPDGTYRRHTLNQGTGERTYLTVWPTQHGASSPYCVAFALGFEPLDDAMAKKLAMPPGSSVLQCFVITDLGDPHRTTNIDRIAEAVEAPWVHLRSDVDLNVPGFLRHIAVTQSRAVAMAREAQQDAAFARLDRPRSIGGAPVSPGAKPSKWPPDR